MLKPIFKKEEHQLEFEKTGFIIIRQLIPPLTVQKLRDLYSKYEKEHWGDKLGMHSTAHISNCAILRDIYDQLKELTSDYADQYLTNYKFYLGNFLVKESRPDSVFPMHQDWTCVDESKYYPVNFWMDLGGTDLRNGCMFFLKGSHRLRAGVLRCAPIGPTPWDNIRDIAPLFYTYLQTQAGDAVFLNPSALHGSVANSSGHSRIAAVLGACSAEAQLLHYYLEEGGTIDKIERLLVDTEGLINMPRGRRPPGYKLDGYEAYTSSPVMPEEFVHFMMDQLSGREKLTFYSKKIKHAFF